MSSQLEPIFAGGKSSLRMAHSLPVSRCGLIEGLGSSTSSPELEFRLPTVDALRAALPGLEKRRAFVPDATGIAMQQPCDLVLVHPEGGARLAIRAEVVWVQPDGPGKGIGVELKALDVAKLHAFVGGAAEKPAEPPPPEEPATDARHADVDDADATDGPPDRAKGLYDKIRAMTTRERETCARSGALSERVALERCYGASVWEGLLHNPQITPPEVARIARNGTVSVPLLSVIVANGGWIAVGEVQRALLANPRLSGSALDRVLGALSSSDLRRVSQQTAYRAPVRQAAQRLMKR
jgi:hypothetical protein